MKLHQHAREIFSAGLAAVNPANAIQKFLHIKENCLWVGRKEYDLNSVQRIYVVGAGKAGATMAQGMEAILGERIHRGWVNVKYHHLLPTKTIKLHEAGHPIPDDSGKKGVEEIVSILKEATASDLVFCLISGGGSALLPAPAPGITLEDKKALTQQLLCCGASIHEINTIRKHISRLKGGQIARLAYPATLITLLVSDVVGDSLDIIASGPTVPDSSSFGDCLTILEKYELLNEIPLSVLFRIQSGFRNEIPEIPKIGDPIFEKTQNLLLSSNFLAAKAAAQKAQELGYKPMILSTCIEGETKEVAKVHAAILKEVLRSGHPLPPPACLISGGETTVSIKSNGLGGRNQEFVLAAALEIQGLKGVVVLSAGTDGTDGPTDAAGAIADGNTIWRAWSQNLDAQFCLRNHDSYPFFKQLGDLVKTGPTNTNVMDLRILLVE